MRLNSVATVLQWFGTLATITYARVWRLKENQSELTKNILEVLTPSNKKYTLVIKSAQDCQLGKL